MQYVWQFRLWPPRRMYTTGGERVEVLDPGLHNKDAGPDFFNAKICIDGVQWAGNVEIHVKASDWHRHHHDGDKAYDSVVLHVVEVNDAEIHRSDGRVIPQMVMRCERDFSELYRQMVGNTFRELACGNELETLPSLYVTDWLTSLGYERLYEKTDRIMQLLHNNGDNWSEAVYVTLARALGFSTNSEPFQLLALSTPLKHMLHYTDSLVSIEAMLFGQAGMLETVDTGGEAYLIRLVDEYKFLKAKYSLQRSNNIFWKMARMRPQNFPHRRIATLAQLIYRNFVFSNRILEIKDEADARKLFDIELSGWWTRHFNFSANLSDPYSTASDRPVKALSYSSVTILLINVVVPLIMAYALHTGDLKRQEFAIDLLHSLRAESNRIVDTFVRAGIKPANAFDSQALIQLRRVYCEPRKCLYCRIGHHILSEKAVNGPNSATHFFKP